MEAKQQGIGDDETADKKEAIKKEEKANGYQNDNTQKSDSRKSAEQKKENLESDGLKTENENEGLRGEGKQNEKSGQESGVEREKQEKHTESIYKQESDIRKAGKRVREQQKGMEESKSEEDIWKFWIVYYPTGRYFVSRLVYRIMEIWMLLKKYAD